jgi:hypothetical protein
VVAVECQAVWAVWAEWVVWGEWECNIIPYRNILKTKVKQITNPQKEISGGFLFLLYKLKIITNKDMIKISNLVET